LNRTDTVRSGAWCEMAGLVVVSSADLYPQSKMKNAIVLSLVLAAVTMNAREPDLVVKVWPGKPPGAQVPGPEKDLTNATAKNVGGKRLIRLGGVSEPTLSVYRPQRAKDTGAAVVICPGGGYNILALDLEGTEVADWLNTLGVTGIVLKYRVPMSGDKKTKWQTPLKDAQRALSLVRSKAKEWKLDPERIGILGFSAGGNLSALASTRFEKREYAAIDEVDKVSPRPNFACLIYPAWLNREGTTELNEFFPVSKDTPPMFFAHAMDDPIECEASIAMFLALRKLKIPADLHVYDRGGHGYGLRRTELPVTTWPDRCADWLRVRGLLGPEGR
jgi:acetyl esterase/lipase